MSALYDAAGKKVFSAGFPLNRGVVQGDIFSPVAFILALALVLCRHGQRSDQGCEQGAEAGAGCEGVIAEGGSEPPEGCNSFANLLLLLLGSMEYADDAALVDIEEAAASLRVSRLEAGAKQDADMEISRPKTEVMHAQQQAQVSPAKPQDYAKITQCKAPVLKHVCQYCGDGFDTQQGLRKHTTSHCEEAKRRVYGTTEEEWEVERVLDARGSPQFRFYLVRWAGWEEAGWSDSWESWRDMLNAAEAVDQFWAGSELSRDSTIEVAGEVRCCWCNRLYTGEYAARSLKSHHTRKPNSGGCKLKPKSRVGSRAERAVIRKKKEDAQGREKHVWIGDHKLKNIYAFKYLGFMFLADGDRRHAVAVRMAIARARFGQMFNIWGSTVLPISAQVQLFEAGVVSVLVYGSEVWPMDTDMKRSLRGWCAKCLTHITGKSIVEENRDPSYPLVAKVLRRRFKWLGHSLRRSGSLVQTVLLQHAKDRLDGKSKNGDIILEAPKYDTIQELLELVGDKESWGCMSNLIC